MCEEGYIHISVCKCNVFRPPTYLPAHLRLPPTVGPNPEKLQNFAVWREATQRPHEMQNANCQLRATQCKVQKAHCQMHHARSPSPKSFPLGFPTLLSGLAWLPSVWSFFDSVGPFKLFAEERMIASENQLCAAVCSAKTVF